MDGLEPASGVKQYPASVPKAKAVIGDAPVKLLHVTVEWSCACGMRHMLCYNPVKTRYPEVECNRCRAKYAVRTESEVEPR